MNNWIEPVVRLKGEKKYNFVDVGVAYNYDDAIQLGKELLLNNDFWDKYERGEL